MVTKTYNLSLDFEAPLNFVYRWCTDYREDDLKILGSKVKRHIISKSRTRAAWINHFVINDMEVENVRIVTLNPPSKWSVLGLGEDLDEEGHYVLKTVGKNRTRLTMTFKVKYKSAPVENKRAWEGQLAEEWDKYRTVLEQDYGESGRRRKL